MTTKTRAPQRRPRTTSKVTAWRVQYLTAGGVVGPFHDFAKSAAPDPIGLRLTSHCFRDATHAPPEAGCWCGIYACDDVRSLTSVVHAAEFRRANAIKTQPEGMPWLSRVMIVRGVLGDAVRAKRPGGGALVPIWSDGEVGRRYAPPGVRVAAFGVRGDPPGTWRGRAFTPTGLVMQAERDDDLADFSRDFVGLEHHFITELGVDSLLSTTLRRYVASGRSDRQWWTA